MAQAERERRWFFVRAAGQRRFGWWRQRLAEGGGFVAVDLGHYRLGRKVAGPGHVVDVPVSASEPNPPKAGR